MLLFLEFIGTDLGILCILLLGTSVCIWEAMNRACACFVLPLHVSTLLAAKYLKRRLLMTKVRTLCFHLRNMLSFFWLNDLWDRDSTSGRGAEKREKENPKQAPHLAQSPSWGSISRPWDHDLSHPELGLLTDWATQAPQFCCYLKWNKPMIRGTKV